MVSATTIVEFAGVVKDYPTGWFGRGRLRALTDVSFQIQAGEVVGLVGPNRAGKTTVVKLLLSLCRLQAGRILRFGRPVSERSTLQRIGYLHEHQAFPRYLTPWQILEYYGALALLSEPEVQRRIHPLLERVGLADRSHEPVSRFSKGMIGRLGLAQALLTDPDLLVLDEPTEGLDLEGRQMVREIVDERRRRGQSVLFISHVVAEVERLCDRLMVLVQGHLAFLGSPTALTVDSTSGTSRPLEAALQQLYRKPQT